MADVPQRGTDSTKTEDAEKQARFDRMVLALDRMTGFEAAFKAALASYDKDETLSFDPTPFGGARLAMLLQLGEVPVEDQPLFIRRFQDHFLDGVGGDPTSAWVVKRIFGWEAAPKADALPGERREVRAGAAMVLNDAERKRQLEEFKNGLTDSLIGSDGWKRPVLQKAILGRGDMLLREFLQDPAIFILLGGLQGLQLRYGFSIEDEDFFRCFFQVFVQELNQDGEGAAIEDPNEVKLCEDRAKLIWREIFKVQEPWEPRPLPSPPPPPVRTVLPDAMRDLDALDKVNEQKAVAIRDSIESKKSAWEALFKFWNGDVSPLLLELPATCELRTALSAVLIGLGYTEETEELKLVMNRALQLLPMVGPGMDPSNPLAFLQTIDAWVRKLYKEILADIFRKRELQPLVRVDDSLGTPPPPPPPPPPVRSAEPGERLDSGALDVRDAQNAGTISKFIESKKSAWEALFKESKDESNPNLSGSSGYQKLRAELRDLLINSGYAEDPGRLIPVMDRVVQLFQLYPSSPSAAERDLDDFVCNLLVRMVKGIFQDGALKAVARVERQRLAPLLFQAGGPRDPALPEGMPQPFRIEKVVSNVKLGASAEHHEVYELGNVHAMTHIGVKTEGKKFNQGDRARVTVFKTKEGRVVTRLSIADGMGGVEDGDLAADLAVDALGQPVPYLEAEKMVREELKKRGAEEAGACVVSVDICGSIAQPHRRGDARLYHFNRKGICVWMSTDECRATQVRSYDLPLEEGALRQNARGEDADGRRLNSVTNDLSVHHENTALDVLEPRFLMPGDFLLLCSDGLSDTMGNFEIFSGLHRGTLLKDLLARMNAGKGKADNVVVILYEMPLTQGDSILGPQKITESLNP